MIVETGTYSIVQKQKLSLPAKGQVHYYILTSAQNNTYVHDQLWKNILAFADYLNARVMAATFTYNKMTNPVSTKRKTSQESDKQPEWWDRRLEPYICDDSIILAPGLVWCGELQILPTAVNPLSGMESYTGRASSIIPHSKFATVSVASPKSAGTKFLYTTGTVTLRNYIQKKAGQKAEFHHGYGAVLVEVDSDGTWFVRPLKAGSDGTFYDFDTRVKNGQITSGHRPEAIIWGDIHERQLDDDTEKLAWGKRGILDQLEPKRQIFHDLIDFRAQNHHDRDDPWKMFEKSSEKKLSIYEEIGEAHMFLYKAHRQWCESVVVCSNHDMAFVRWLKETDFRSDPLNARLYLKANLAVYEAIAKGQDIPYPVEWAFQQLGTPNTIKFLRRDESYIVCPDANGGVELGMHGDIGLNGSRSPNLRAFAKTGRKCVVAHGHSAGEDEGATRVGVMGKLDQGYNEGMSSWSHTNCLIYPNGKRALFTIYNGKWRA
ncbi:hypothetical protein LCGC14_0903560 [marine sediment metagenome]|uniref:Uncharacterized protein n=1 Tax=marine sediment metagenome TaxID=412755 RepID=A0A0F9PGF2_9ZZZZ